MKTQNIRKFRIVQSEGVRDVSREIMFYNLDGIISVGYRVNSKQATQIRRWAAKTLKQYIITFRNKIFYCNPSYIMVAYVINYSSVFFRLSGGYIA